MAAEVVALGQPLWVLRDQLCFRLLSSDTGGAYTLYDHSMGAGRGSPLHTHSEQDEVIYVILSEFEVRIGPDVYRLTPGGVALLPRGIPHSFRNVQRMMGRLLVIASPGEGVEAFWSEMASRFGLDAAVDMEKMRELYGRYGMELLGPPQHF